MARAGATVINIGVGAIGEMKSAMISEVDFQAQFGTEWILADGRNVAGSKYETLTGNSTVPDARGLALRGKNNGRIDGNENPDGDLALGAFQGHQLGSGSGTANSGGAHSHSVTQCDSGGLYGAFNAAGGYLFGDIGTVNYAPVNRSGFVQNSSTHTHTVTISSGNETRMKNMTVNHFIKIN